MPDHLGQNVRPPLPVFPFSDLQVEDVADALEAAGEADFIELARLALTTVARTMVMQREEDPMGYPKGYGYRTVRAVTPWFVVHPDDTWEAPRGCW